jgi:hypothetical protein
VRSVKNLDWNFRDQLLGRLINLRGEWTAFAVVTGRIVFLQETNRESLSPNSRLPFFRCEMSACCEATNIREMLLKFVLGPALQCALRGFLA